VRSANNEEEPRTNVIIHQRHYRKGGADNTLTPKNQRVQESSEKPQSDQDITNVPAVSNTSKNSRQGEVVVAEKPVSKDYRSFAATAFGTVAFKMLEWLTPNSVDTLSQKVSELQSEANAESTAPKHGESSKVSISKDDPGSTPAKTSDEIKDRPTSPPMVHSVHYGVGDQQDTRNKRDHTGLRRGPKTTFRQPTAPDGTRRKSIDSVRRVPPPDKLVRRPRSPTSISFKPAFFENVTLHPPASDEVTITSSDGEESVKDTAPSISVKEARESSVVDEKTKDVESSHLEETAEDIACPLPQSFRELNAQLIDFICGVFLEDHTFEAQFFGTSEICHNYPIPQEEPRKLVRRDDQRDVISRHQWKAFNEQTLFSVLSDPTALVSSFTKDGKLFDSHSLWYCMVRLTRAAPSLVLHSLWISAGSLCLPQKPSKSSRRTQKTLTSYEAQSVMSACLHALVALAPVVQDSKTLYDMSRIRSNGLALAVSGPSARRPPDLCLQYDDVFSNTLAMRLARRLFRALTAHRSSKAAPGGKTRSNCDTTDEILNLLLTQLDILNTDSTPILEFARDERLLHETRVPTLLLDWARAVLLHEWDGEPVFSTHGSFYGALSFMKTLRTCFFPSNVSYRSATNNQPLDTNRDVLLLGDIQFRVDYFSDRLDTMHVPVSWLDFTSTAEEGHILDYPYLFRPETLVSYFRSINFSKMSRSFEEASSLRRRMGAIVDPGSLINNPHHKTLLKDMLRIASSRYLVLDIGRDAVLRDAFDQLWRREKRELFRPLKVHLGEDTGEEGFDSGGVQQEFFRMAMAECLDPIYGAFTIDDRTRMAWFKPRSYVEDWKFELIGLLFSLAIYNGLTLPITFPKAFYRKLLGQPVELLYHIADGWPELASGLTTLDEWDEKDGLIEDVFARTYEFSVPGVGEDINIQMLEDKKNSPRMTADSHLEGVPEAPFVTNENREDYVTDYIQYLVNYSIQPQFEAFRRGFLACLEGKSLSLVTPNILQSVVEGTQEIDISELRRYARYVGWDAGHHTVKDFWSIVKRYDDRMKHKLLEFVTASDRVPVGGLKNVQFVIQKNGEEGEGGHLPTAYTCYGTLLLPEYHDKEVLRDRLGMALENAQGFGFA
jgi:hypothetical protein